MSRTFRPIKRFVLLVEETIEGEGVFLATPKPRLDLVVAAIGTEENPDFGVGDRVLVKDIECGRRVRLDGVLYRLVRVKDILAVIG